MLELMVGITSHGDFTHTFIVPALGITVEGKGRFNGGFEKLNTKLREYVELCYPNGLNIGELKTVDASTCRSFVDEWIAVPIEEINIEHRS